MLKKGEDQFLVQLIKGRNKLANSPESRLRFSSETQLLGS